MAHVRYYGNKQDGYSAHGGKAWCRVKRTPDGWTATYVVPPTPPSLSCPVVAVPGTFKTRDAAARAGLDAFRREWGE